MEELQLDIVAQNGDPLGIIKYTSYNWQGIQYKIPRNMIFSNNEIVLSLLDKVCAYILVGKDEDKIAYYIGEAENCITRIKQHKSKDWWTEVLIFLGNKEYPLDKAQAKYIEHDFYKEAKINQKSNQFKIMNSNTPTKSSLDSKIESRIIKYIDTAKKLTLLQNLKLFYKQNELLSTNTKQLLHLSRDGKILAYGNRTNNGFIVKKGALITPEMTMKTTPCFKTFREKLKHDGIIKNNKLAIDFEFSSPSAAAVQILGHNSNGLEVWKNEEGKKLNDIEK